MVYSQASVIKKFLFPILIGFLAYFGFDLFKSNPLGFIQANALEENDSNYIENIDNYSEPLDFDDSLESFESEEPIDITEHKGLFNKIYWFDDNTTEIGILTSIYEVLFLYCLTMVCFRILTFIKNQRW